jgi:hypothetical protein
MKPIRTLALAALFMVGGALAPKVAHAACSTTASSVSGFFYNPYSDKIVSGTSRPSFTYDGYLNSPNVSGDNQVVDIQVLATPSKPVSSPVGTGGWEVKATVSATGSGARFFSVTSSILNNTNFPQGNIARVRAVWKNICNGSTKVLDITDAAGLVLPPIGTQPANQLFVDPDPFSATTSRPYLSKKGNDFPPGTVNRDIAINYETMSYYSTVKTGSDGVSGGSIISAFPTLQAFRNRYFPGKTERVAKYYNRGDLGIGREMHCVFASGGESACYVFNFAPKNSSGNLVFGDKAGSLKDQFTDKNVPFAAVAMAERGAMPRSPDPGNRMLFAVFVCQKASGESTSAFKTRCASLSEHKLFLNPVQLDNVGHNNFNPGNCINCHGINSSYNKATDKVFGAQFLPFDLDAFDFPTNDATATRAAQQGAFRELNRGVYFSDFYFLPASRTVRAWYNDTWTGDFDGTKIGNLSDWGSTSAKRRLYDKVYGPYCRTCHISAATSRAYFNFADLYAERVLAGVDVCQLKAMPHAQQTFNLSAAGNMRSVFLGHLGLEGECKVQ